MIERETHQFTVDKSIILHLIESQAGTLGKAVLECITNSIDAGAKAVNIELTADSISVVDDGHGLRTRDEILSVFKRFGFDHSNHQRTYGKFGLGRGQLWRFARTCWFSHNFELDVDVRARGIEFYLSKDKPHVDGLRIEGTFYEPMTAVERSQFQNELERLCRYSLVPVFLNGRRLGKDPADTRWTIETDDAYITVTDGNMLAVYNQGVFVKDMYAGHTGVGGTVVTKRGRNLELNMARNDVMVRTCPVWLRVEKVLKKVADERTGKTKAKRLTDTDRDYIARQTADPEYIGNFDQAIFTLTNGKHLSLHKLVRNRVPFTVADDGDRMADAILRDNAAVVFSRKTLARFDATTVRELIDILVARTDIGKDHWWTRQELLNAKVEEDITKCEGYRRIQASKIPEKDLSVNQRRVLTALRDMNCAIVRAMGAHDGRQTKVRDLVMGRGDAEAYTDGFSYIAFVAEPTEQAAKSGLSGFIRLAQVMVHEYLHDTDDAGSHGHDAEFYQAFHDITLEQHREIFAAAKQGFTSYAKALERTSQRVAVDLDSLDRNDKVVALAAKA